MNSSTIYHYTTAQGLLGIIQNQEIWATRSLFLNDPSEVVFAATTLVDMLQTRLEDATNESVNLPVLEKLIERIPREFAQHLLFEQYVEHVPFIASFSRDGDQLEMWRSYAGAGGFAIGFDPEVLTAWTVPRAWHYEISPHGEIAATPREIEDGHGKNFGLLTHVSDVKYGVDPIKSLVEECWEAVTSPDEVEDEDLTVRAVISRLAGALPLIKHESHQSEGETRLLANETGDLAPLRRVRTTDRGLASYHAVTFPPEAIVSIRCAPGTDLATTKSALADLLGDGGRGRWAHVQIEHSTIPVVL